MDYRTKRLESRYIAWPKIRTSRIKCKEEVGGRKIRTESCDEILEKLFFFFQERKQNWKKSEGGREILAIYELLEEKGKDHESIPLLRFFRPEARTISYTYNGTRCPCRGRCKFWNVGSLATCSRCIPAVFSLHPNSTGPFESCWLVGFRLDAVSLYRFILHLFASLSRRSAQVSWLLSFFLCLSTSRCCPPYKPQITNAYAIQPFFAPWSHGSSSRGS